MKPGAVIVDVAIDQGGCVETSRPDDPPRADLRRRRRGPLLRDQHARGRRPDEHLRPLQRDAPLRPPARRARLAAGRRRRPGRGRGGQHRPGPGDQPGRRRDLRPALRPLGRRRPVRAVATASAWPDRHLRCPVRIDRSDGLVSDGASTIDDDHDEHEHDHEHDHDHDARARGRGGARRGPRARHPEPDLPGDAAAEPRPAQIATEVAGYTGAPRPAQAGRPQERHEEHLGHLLRVLRLDRPRGVGRGRGRRGRRRL